MPAAAGTSWPVIRNANVPAMQLATAVEGFASPRAELRHNAVVPKQIEEGL
jgi:hypothetical protein